MQTISFHCHTREGCKEWCLFSYLEAEDLGLDERQGTAVDLNDTTARLHRNLQSAYHRHRLRKSSFRCGYRIASEGQTDLALGDGGGRLLLAEALHALSRRHGCCECPGDIFRWVSGQVAVGGKRATLRKAGNVMLLIGNFRWGGAQEARVCALGRLVLPCGHEPER